MDSPQPPIEETAAGSARRPMHESSAPAAPLLRTLGILFLVVQAALIFYARFHPRRDVHVSPLDGETNYHVHVFIAGDDLPPAAVQARYGLPQYGRVALSPDALKAIVRHREGVSGHRDGAAVRLHFAHNGAPWEVWLWPEG